MVINTGSIPGLPGTRTILDTLHCFFVGKYIPISQSK